ncbi:PCMD domain-containing protein [Phocaeicola coprophilus]|nr:PCMD domain-containing protein [Phocaeicola coprophilus]
MKRINHLLALAALLGCASLHAQEREELLPFGDMNQWIKREIKESSIIGGAQKEIYAVGPTQTIKGEIPYKPTGGSPWATSNVMAKVVGIVKTNSSVFPERRDGGYCARLDTHLEGVKVFGVVDITVLAAGSLFLGEVHEPIKSTKNPNGLLLMGVPFTKHPKALRFDYKVRIADREKRIRATGFGRETDVDGKDHAAVVCLLQKRWEDKEGNVYASRVGTFAIQYDKSCDWQNAATYTILYGDITHNPAYRADLMKLNAYEYNTVNSRGKSVPIKEVSWAAPDEAPTHIILQFASSHGGAYIGTPGNSLWVDNVKLVY